ncbi:EamA family transporter RarD [Psychrobacter sp. LV10R520-6]|uniref:EamA family transporter RarD n=1 Tax=Psychrobacter sp. LV10R520-6 TaxID=1415574 RepID=UPI0024CB6E7F|nr:EamA family transporter RarD [Psychrobacter sp. LV10R520-6]SNT69395.1 chloramphenicol-sensitive protein RarD [Psychrobacter sp. LV10R520-6]
MLTTNQTVQGTSAATSANFLFSLLFLFGLFLHPLSGTQVASWRVLLMLFSLVLLVSILKQWQHVFDYLKTLKTRKEWFLFILPTPILGGQIWLFMWGPVNGLGLDVTLGYFLYPLVMILVGRFFYHESMSALQWVATLCAAAGIAYDVLQHGTVSWATLFVCLGYPPYYLLRRKLAVPPITGLISDLVLLTPVVLVALYSTGGFELAASTSKLWYLLPLLGIISTAAMSLTMIASRKLPVSLFGTLSYLEPIFLFIFSITLLNQNIEEGGSLFMYGMIFVALLIMIMDSAMGYVGRRRDNRLHGYNEPQINNFPPRRRLKNRRIKGVLTARRFRKIKRYQQKIDKMTNKIEQLHSR